MNVEYSGYREDHGFFRFLIPVDERKEDYELHLKDGRIVRQKTPFQEETYDWNNDGDVYTQFGAWFDWDGRGEFLTPTDMVSLVLDGRAEIPGIQDPLRRPSLDKTIQDAEAHKPAAGKPLDHPSPER